MFTGGTSPYTPGENLYRMSLLDPDNESDQQQGVRDFWEIAAGDNGERLSMDAAYVMAFADGAVEVWNEVADQL
jgi:hypothetical protein